MDQFSDRYSNVGDEEAVDESRNGFEGDEEEEDDGTFLEVIATVIAALALAWFVQGYLIKPFRIPSESMENTLRCRDRVLVDRVSYHLHGPARNDVVVFHPPSSVSSKGKVDRDSVGMSGDAGLRVGKNERVLTPAKVNFIKRIVGLPGDRLSVHSDHVYINGKKQSEPFLHPLDAATLGSSSDWGPITVPDNTYFMMGDNRENSTDARYFGPVPRQFIVGKAFVVYWPPTRFGTLPAREAGGPDAAKQDPNCLESGIG